LILTKPIGTGVVGTALKNQAASRAHTNSAVAWMTKLNRAASESMVVSGASACTDVSGYGLLGHLLDVCRASGVDAHISAHDVPLLPGAEEYAKSGYSPAGTHTNLEYLAESVRWLNGVDETSRLLLADPQTSGGLLIALPEASAMGLIRRIGRASIAVCVGHVAAPAGETVVTVAA